MQHFHSIFSPFANRNSNLVGLPFIYPCPLLDICCKYLMPNVQRNKIDAERQMTPINSQILERSPENDLFDDTKGGILISPEVGGGERGGGSWPGTKDERRSLSESIYLLPFVTCRCFNQASHADPLCCRLVMDCRLEQRR